MSLRNYKFRKILNVQNGIIFIILLTFLYYTFNPIKMYEDGELYHSKFTRIMPAAVAIVNRENPDEYFRAVRSTNGFYAEFHNFNGEIFSVKEIPGGILRNIGSPISTGLWAQGKAYFSSLYDLDEMVVWEVDFETKDIKAHDVMKLDIFTSLLDTVIYKKGVCFSKPKINSQLIEPIVIQENNNDCCLIFSKAMIDSLTYAVNLELLNENSAYIRVRDHINSHIRSKKSFTVYDVFEIINFFRRNGFYRSKYFNNMTINSTPVSNIYLLNSVDANKDGSEDLLILARFNRFINDKFICYDVRNDTIIWQRDDIYNIKNLTKLDIDADGDFEFLFSTYSACNEVPIDFYSTNSFHRDRSYFCILNSVDGTTKLVNGRPAILESPRGYYEFRFTPIENSKQILMGLMARSDFEVKKLFLYDYLSNSTDTLNVSYTNLLGFNKKGKNIVVFDNPLNKLCSFTLGSDFEQKACNTIDINRSKIMTIMPSMIDIDKQKYNLLLSDKNIVIDNKLKEYTNFDTNFMESTFQSFKNCIYFLENRGNDYYFTKVEFFRNRTLNPLMINILVFELISFLLFLFLKQSLSLPVLPIKDNYFVIHSFFGILYIWKLTGAFSRFFKLPKRISWNRQIPYKYLHDLSDQVQEFYTHSALFVKTKVYKIHTEKELSIIQRISHDLKNQLLMIKLQVDEYYNGLKKKKSEKVCSILETIKDISQVAQTLSNFSQINELYKEKVSINSLLDEILIDLYNHPNIDSVEVNIGKEFILQADEKLLKIALKNIISNALDAVEIEKGHRIVISVRQVDHVVSIIIKNPTSFDSSKFDEIMKLGFTTKSSGSGLGIPIARSIIEKHDGKFQIMLENQIFIVEIYLPYEV